MHKTRVNLRFTTQRQLILQHQSGDRQAVAFAKPQQFAGGAKIIGHRDVGILRSPAGPLFDDKTAADRIVGLARPRLRATPGGNTHPVFVIRKGLRVEHDVVRHLKVYALHAVSDRQTPAVHHLLNKCRHGVNINILRAVSRQSHNNRDIGRMTFTGQRQRTIEVDHDTRDMRDIAHVHQLVDKTFSGIHRPYGVRTGRTNTGFKNIECANHIPILGLPLRGEQEPPVLGGRAKTGLPRRRCLRGRVPRWPQFPALHPLAGGQPARSCASGRSPDAHQRSADRPD